MKSLWFVLLVLGFSLTGKAGEQKEVKAEVVQVNTLFNAMTEDVNSCSVHIRNTDKMLPVAVYLEDIQDGSLIKLQGESDISLSADRTFVYLRLFDYVHKSERSCKEFKKNYSVIVKY